MSKNEDALHEGSPVFTSILGVILAVLLGAVAFFTYNIKVTEVAMQPQPSDTPEENEEIVEEYDPVTIVAFGDMMLGRYVWQLMEKNGHDYPFEQFPELLDEMLTDEAGQSMGEPDFIMANLEGPISDSDYVNPGDAMIFNFKPVITETLNKYGFNLMSIANNHSYDMGEKGMTQTRDYLDAAGIHYFGEAKGVTDDSMWVTTVEEKGATIAFVGFNHTLSDRLKLEEATALLEEAESAADFTVVSIHWGREYETQPTQEQVDMAHAFVDAGADVILGHHPHVVATREIYEGKPIYYSLGNFIFDQYFSEEVQRGFGLTLQFFKSKDPNAESNAFTVLETEFVSEKSQVKLPIN